MVVMVMMVVDRGVISMAWLGHDAVTTYRYAFLISSCVASGLIPKAVYNLVSATILAIFP